MKVIYISGPISKGDLLHNIRQADAAYLALVRAGHSPICPHWSVYGGGAWRTDGDVWAEARADGHMGMTHADWLRVDLAVVDRCDAVLRLPGESVGAEMECSHAEMAGIPVYPSLDELISDYSLTALVTNRHNSACDQG